MLTRLKLMNFRCYSHFSWFVPEQGAIIIGDNARGKTSLLEAICFLLRLQSPRTSRLQPMQKHGTQQFGVRGEISGQVHRLLWNAESLDLQINGEPINDQRSYLANSWPVVWLGNDDLTLVRTGADARRRYMDFVGAQWHPEYRLSLFNYRKILKTRNYLLKHKPGDKLQLDTWSQMLAVHGDKLSRLRNELLTLLCPHIIQAYAHISGQAEHISVEYQASSAPNSLYDHLCNELDRDIRYGQTQTGPHRDDLLIQLNGNPAAQFASEGQQRSICIAMKLAQSALLCEETGRPPIHLIDDVFGELDPSRRLAFINALPPDSQSIITTTQLQWMPKSQCPYPVFTLADGQLHPSIRES